MQNQAEELRHVSDELCRANQKIAELSRQAAVVEAATEIVHNIGNALNSVVLAAELIQCILADSKSEGLQKLADLLDEHSEDLAAFLTGDEQGRKALPYLRSLAKSLSEERTAIRQHLKTLTEKVECICSIVETQQMRVKNVMLADETGAEAVNDGSAAPPIQNA